MAKIPDGPCRDPAQGVEEPLRARRGDDQGAQEDGEASRAGAGQGYGRVQP